MERPPKPPPYSEAVQQRIQQPPTFPQPSPSHPQPSVPSYPIQIIDGSMGSTSVPGVHTHSSVVVRTQQVLVGRGYWRPRRWYDYVFSIIVLLIFVGALIFIARRNDAFQL